MDSNFSRQTTVLLLAFLLLVGFFAWHQAIPGKVVSQPPHASVSPSLQPPITEPSPTSEAESPKAMPAIDGIWYVHRGKAIDTLEIQNADGVLTGTLTDDIEWEGRTWPIHGLIVGNNVSWFYTKTDKERTADYSLKGIFEKNKMSGTFRCLSIVTGIGSTSSEDELWIASREK
jgi:hypothetical protein